MIVELAIKKAVSDVRNHPEALQKKGLQARFGNK